MTFYEKLNRLCINQGTSVTALAVALGYSRSIATTWKNSKGMPRANTVKKIADHFNLPISYFYEADPQSAASGEASALGTSADTEASKADVFPIGDIEKELLSICRSLDMKRKNALLTKAYEIEQEFLSEAHAPDKKGEAPHMLTVYTAAKSSDNHPPKMTEMSLDSWKAIENAPDTDDDLL